MKIWSIFAPPLIAGLLALAAGGVQASTIATWSSVKVGDWSYQMTNTNGRNAVTDTYTYSAGSVADSIWYTGTKLKEGTGAQDDLLANLNYYFPPTSGSSIAFVSGCNTPTTGCTPGASDSAATGSYTFTSPTSFEFLFVHFGSGELLFHWKEAVSSITISGPSNVSNYRAYNDPVSSVPEPETYAMMVAGLGVLGIALRRRKNTA